MTASRRKGLTVLELIVVIAVLGILFGIGFAVLPRERIAMNQAAERFERDLQRARFNAISYNTTVRIDVDAENSAYRAAPVPASGSAQRAGFEVVFDQVGLNGVGIALGGTSDRCDHALRDEGRWLVQFDARGVGRWSGSSIVVFSHERISDQIMVCVNSYGKVQRL